jgi:hypothetical protein
MQVTSVATTPSADPASLANDNVPLTPEMLFAFCESQMGVMDKQANDYFTEAQKNNDLQSAVANTLGDLHNLQKEMKGDLVDDAPLVNKIQGDLTNLKNALPDNLTQESSTIDGAISVLMNGNDTKVSSSEAQNVIDTLNSVNTDISSNNSLVMIHLQSAMSQREQVIQLTTNILQTIDDSASKVVGNIHS